MAHVVVIILVVLLIVGLGVGVVCTWSWWKRWLNRCLSSGNPTPNARFEPDPAYPEQLDPRGLDRNGRPYREPVYPRGTGRQPDPVTFDPLPTFVQPPPGEGPDELRRIQLPEGITSTDGESSFHEHDWFHPPYENFPRDNLNYLNSVGVGWFGKVIQAEAKGISPQLPVKTVMVKQLRDDASESEQLKFLNQCRVYRDTTHPNLLKLIAFSVDRVPYLTIFEYWPLGDVKSYLMAKERAGEAASLVSQGVIARMAIDIARALEWIFSEGFVHSDLSARNCLVANVAGKVVLGDYGLGPRKFPRDYYRISNFMLPIRWAAPESYEFTQGSCNILPITEAANIFSFGVLLWELFEFGKLPYGSMSDEEVISKVLVKQLYLMEPPNVSYAQRDVSERLYRLMLSSWRTVPEERPKITEIIRILTLP